MSLPNCAFAASSCVNAFTTRRPSIISCILPFISPSAFCCSRYSLRLRPPMVLMARKLPASTRSVMRNSGGQVTMRMTTMPTNIRLEENIDTMLCSSICCT